MHDGEYWYLSDTSGERFGPSGEQLVQAFQECHGLLDFEVIYVGQGYGKGGSRNAIDRLRSHETLQMIALKGVPDGHMLHILLLAAR